MASTADFKNGLALVLDNELYVIIEFQHVKPGKGGAFVRTKLKNARKGKIIDKTFNAGEKIETARLETREMQYLYSDGQSYVFMNLETYEQIEIPTDLVGDSSLYLKENMICNVLVYAETEEILGVDLPNFVELEVVETDPGVKGDTVSGGTKPAKVETGAVIQVPLFLNVGTKIKIDTRTNKYIERV